MPHFLRCALLICAAALTGCASIERLAIPDARAIEASWTRTSGTAEANHDAWSEFLARYAS